MKAPVAGPGGACIGRHINEVAAARVHRLTVGRTGCPIGRVAGVSPASGAGVIREHASPSATSWPVMNEPAPAINGPEPVCLITSSAAKVALRHLLRVLLL
jgi:hypothetical protein